MELNDRQQQIFDLVCAHKKISVAQLAETLYVTPMTVRRDLSAMEQGGYIKRYRGGAMELSPHDAFPVSRRTMIDEEEKRALGKRAASFLRDDTCIFIDSSSTTSFLIPHIRRFKNIRVVTNSVHALLLLAQMNVPVFLIGGEDNEHDMCCIGSNAEQTAHRINVDLAFLSTLGISEDGSITESSPHITAVKERIMQHARHTVFLFEQSKIGKRGVYTLCHKEDEDVTVLCSCGE